MIVKKYLIFIMLFIFYENSAQSNDTEAALYNVLFGGITSGLGATFNKKKDEKYGKVFLKGFYQGALGGYVTFESKRILKLTKNNDDWKLYWSSKLVNSVGNSIKENAANNIDFWNQWNLTIGFNRFEFITKDKFKFRYKIMPITAAYTVDAFLRYKFNATNSLKYGHLIFNQNNLNTSNLGSVTTGFVLTNEALINNLDYSYNKLISHEIIHLYQNDDFNVFNSYYNSLLNKPNFLKKINNNFHYDFHLLLIRAAYLFENYKAHSYYDNFFEGEAGYYSGTKY